MPEGNLLLNGIGQLFIRNIAKKIKNNEKFTKKIGLRAEVCDKLEVKLGPH